MKLFNKIDKKYSTFLTALNEFTALMVCAIMLIITADVIARTFFNHPFQGVSEIVSSGIIILCFFEIPYCQMKGTHVRSTVLYDKAGPKGKAVIELICCVLGIFVFIMIILASWKNTIRAIQIGDAEIAGSIRISTVPGRVSIVFGSFAMVIEYILLIIKNILKLTQPETLASDYETNKN